MSKKKTPKNNSKTIVTINDKYSHLKFKEMSSPKDLSIGMMIQLCENNNTPLSWEWKEVSIELLARLLLMPQSSYRWVRIPNY